MIYVDTASGKMTIDTEQEPVKETIVITRDTAGTHILCSAKPKSGSALQIQSPPSPDRNRSFLGKMIQL